MPKILVNYKHNKKTDTYSLYDNEVVFADLPIAVMDMAEEYEEILVVPMNKVMTVVDKKEYLKVHKQFKLIADENGVIREDQNGVSMYLPKDTDISKLRFLNGQLVLVEDEEEGEE